MSKALLDLVRVSTSLQYDAVIHRAVAKSVQSTATVASKAAEAADAVQSAADAVSGTMRLVDAATQKIANASSDFGALSAQLRLVAEQQSAVDKAIRIATSGATLRNVSWLPIAALPDRYRVDGPLLIRARKRLDCEKTWWGSQFPLNEVDGATIADAIEADLNSSFTGQVEADSVFGSPVADSREAREPAHLLNLSVLEFLSFCSSALNITALKSMAITLRSLHRALRKARASLSSRRRPDDFLAAVPLMQHRFYESHTNVPPPVCAPAAI